MIIRKIILYSILFQMIFLSLYKTSEALEKVTHEKINQYIAWNSVDVFSLDEYLKDYLGFQNGIEETIDSNYVWRWLGQGGKFEDNFPRMRNHFHDPVTDEGLMIGDSALFWAQSPVGYQAFGGNYSWHKTKKGTGT